MEIEVRLSEAEFLKFSWFDVLEHRKLWRAPAVFAVILGVCAAVCFLMRETRGAVALGGVLLAAGLGVPAAYFLSFFFSLRGQAREQKLGTGKYVYTLDLSGSGVAVNNGREHAAYPWGQVFRAYRRVDAVYLYITPRRAFLIPYECVNGEADGLWALIERGLPAERRTARQRPFCPL